MNTIIIGSQWGDEGKGKMIDFLTESADVVARGQGGRHWEGRAAGRKGRPAEKELSGSGGRNGALPPEPAFSRCLHPQR